MKSPESNIESNSTMHVIGIDAGGTKTVCLVADEHGTSSPRAAAPARISMPRGKPASNERSATSWPTRSATARSRPSAICLGMAGIDREDEARVIHGIMQRLGQRSRVVVVNDALIALVAGAKDGARHRHHRRDRGRSCTAATSMATQRVPAVGDT